MTEPDPAAAHGAKHGRDELQRVWTETDRLVGSGTCYTVFGLGLAYLPATVAGLVDSGLDAPIRDPYLAIMELLIIPLAIGLVVAFAAVHSYAPQPTRTLSLGALVLVGMSAGMTIGVHSVVLTVGRHPQLAALPGAALLFSWTWPSVVYALDIAAWDLCLGPRSCSRHLSSHRGPGPARSGAAWWSAESCASPGSSASCLNNMNVRNIGIVGYAVVLPSSCSSWDDCSLTPGRRRRVERHPVPPPAAASETLDRPSPGHEGP